MLEKRDKVPIDMKASRTFLYHEKYSHKYRSI